MRRSRAQPGRGPLQRRRLARRRRDRPTDSGGVAIGIAPSPISPASRRSSVPNPATRMGGSVAEWRKAQRTLLAPCVRPFVFDCFAAQKRADDCHRGSCPLDEIRRVEAQPFDHRGRVQTEPERRATTREQVEGRQMRRDLGWVGRVRIRPERADDDTLRRLGDRGLDRPGVRHERVVRHPHFVHSRRLGRHREIDDFARGAEVLDEPNADLHRARRYRSRPRVSSARAWTGPIPTRPGT